MPNYGSPGKGPKLRVGNVFAVEPMVTAGSPDTYELDDGWTVKTVDGSLAADIALVGPVVELVERRDYLTASTVE